MSALPPVDDEVVVLGQVAEPDRRASARGGHGHTEEVGVRSGRQVREVERPGSEHRRGGGIVVRLERLLHVDRDRRRGVGRAASCRDGERGRRRPEGRAGPDVVEVEPLAALDRELRPQGVTRASVGRGLDVHDLERGGGTRRNGLDRRDRVAGRPTGRELHRERELRAAVDGEVGDEVDAAAAGRDACERRLREVDPAPTARRPAARR